MPTRTEKLVLSWTWYCILPVSTTGERNQLAAVFARVQLACNAENSIRTVSDRGPSWISVRTSHPIKYDAAKRWFQVAIADPDVNASCASALPEDLQQHISAAASAGVSSSACSASSLRTVSADTATPSVVDNAASQVRSDGAQARDQAVAVHDHFPRDQLLFKVHRILTDPGKLDFGDYRLIRKEVFGEGVFGKVIAGTHLPTGRSVAMKILKPNWDCNHVWSEVAVLRELEHPNVVPLLDVCRTNTGVTLVFARAVPLRSRLLVKQNGDLCKHVLRGARCHFPECIGGARLHTWTTNSALRFEAG